MIKTSWLDNKTNYTGKVLQTVLLKLSNPYRTICTIKDLFKVTIINIF